MTAIVEGILPVCRAGTQLSRPGAGVGKYAFLELMARGLVGTRFLENVGRGVVAAGTREDTWERGEGAVSGRARRERREPGSGGKKRMGRVFQ